MSSTRQPLHVYVLEAGVYDGRDIVGVYATPEAAMAAWNPDRRADPHTYVWSVGPDEYGMWTFDGGWDAARIYTFKVAT